MERQRNPTRKGQSVSFESLFFREFGSTKLSFWPVKVDAPRCGEELTGYGLEKSQAKGMVKEAYSGKVVFYCYVLERVYAVKVEKSGD